jgi:hypothetical protein
VGDSAMSAVATAACLHLAGGDKDFSATSPSLDFPDNWGTDTVMAVRLAPAVTAAGAAVCWLLVWHQQISAGFWTGT